MKRKAASRPLADTEWMLEQWGWWRMSGMGVPRYVSPSFALMRDNVEQISTSSYSITDDLALIIDGCIARLSRREDQGLIVGAKMSDCLWLFFGAKYSMCKVGRHLGISETKARDLVKSGVAWIDGRLETIREAA
jgi:hypothetical protein